MHAPDVPACSRCRLMRTPSAGLPTAVSSMCVVMGDRSPVSSSVAAHSTVTTRTSAAEMMPAQLACSAPSQDEADWAPSQDGDVSSMRPCATAEVPQD